MRWLGLDIGGANLKAADNEAFAKQVRFPMWRTPDQLHEELARLIADAPAFEAVALTMTGEMADCFETREEGVCRILEQVTRIIPAGSLKVYAVDGRWLSASQAARSAWHVAASNWKALACYAARWTAGEPTLLIDVGSTTTDIIAIHHDEILSDSLTDHDRLVSGELVYTGVERSSVVGLVQHLPVHGRLCPIVNEHFATIGDVNLILGYADEATDDCETPDNRPKTRSCAAHRLARTVGEDGATLGSTDIEQMAEAVYAAQVEKVAKALLQVVMTLPDATCKSIIFSGHGDHLIEDVLEKLNWDMKRFKLSEKLGPNMSRCAPARAVAVLAGEALELRVEAETRKRPGHAEN